MIHTRLCKHLFEMSIVGDLWGVVHVAPAERALMLYKTLEVPREIEEVPEEEPEEVSEEPPPEEPEVKKFMRKRI